MVGIEWAEGRGNKRIVRIMSVIFRACYVIIRERFCLFHFFLKHFKVHSKIEEKLQRFPILPCPYTCIASLIINIPYQNGTFVTTDESKCTNNYHSNPSPIVHFYIFWIWTNVWWHISIILISCRIFSLS